MKEEGEKITMISAYTYPMSKIIDQMGIDTILVGDSLGMTILGFENTLKVTLDDMIRHTQAVSRGAERALVIGDLPFLSYGLSKKETIKQAGLLIKKGNCQAVKLEGGEERAGEIRALLGIGVPVMGHIGLTPTYVNKFGGFKVQGKSSVAESKLLEDAIKLEDAGVFSIVIESVPWKLQARAAPVRNVRPRPVEQDRDAVLESDEVPDVDEEPREPRDEAVHLEAARLGDGAGASDGRQ